MILSIFFAFLLPSSARASTFFSLREMRAISVAAKNAFNKIKPWLKEMRRKTKKIKYNPKNPENLGGVVLFGVIKVMLHLPHLKNPNNPHKFLHLQIEFGSFKIRIPLGKKVK